MAFEGFQNVQEKSQLSHVKTETMRFVNLGKAIPTWQR